MVGTSKEDKKISIRDFAYYRRRHQNRIHAAIASFFTEEAEAGRITKKRLAELMGKDPSQITRWLSEPSNYEADTISDILLAMNAEMDHSVARFADRPTPNYVHPVIQPFVAYHSHTTLQPTNASTTTEAWVPVILKIGNAPAPSGEEAKLIFPSVELVES